MVLEGGVRVCWPRTSNICIQYFYVYERLKDGTIVVVTYCPTKEMVSDYLSKMLQGRLFCLHRNTLIGITLELVDQYKMEYVAAKTAKAMIIE